MQTRRQAQVSHELPAMAWMEVSLKAHGEAVQEGVEMKQLVYERLHLTGVLIPDWVN